MLPTNEPENLRFTLDTDGIEAKALARIIQDTHLSFKEINKATSGEEIELKIFPFKKGSFEYNISVLALSTSILATGVQLVGLFKEIIAYKKAKLETRKVTSEKFKESKIDKIKENVTINIHLNTLLKAIADNSNGFRISNDSGGSLEFSSSDIKQVLDIERRAAKESKPERRTIEKFNQTLSLVKIASTPHGMWEFIYDDVRIKADVFQSLRNSGRFRNMRTGTKFSVTMKIRQEYNTHGKAWENIGYRITQVNKIE